MLRDNFKRVINSENWETLLNFMILKIFSFYVNLDLVGGFLSIWQASKSDGQLCDVISYLNKLTCSFFISAVIHAIIHQSCSMAGHRMDEGRKSFHKLIWATRISSDLFFYKARRYGPNYNNQVVLLLQEYLYLLMLWMVNSLK